MHSREHLLTYLCSRQLLALQEANALGDPEPEHYALAAVLDELESLGMRVPRARVSVEKGVA